MWNDLSRIGYAHHDANGEFVITGLGRWVLDQYREMVAKGDLT